MSKGKLKISSAMKVLFLSRLYIHLSSKVMNIKNEEVMVYDYSVIFFKRKRRERESRERKERAERMIASTGNSELRDSCETTEL